MREVTSKEVKEMTQFLCLNVKISSEIRFAFLGRVFGEVNKRNYFSVLTAFTA